MFTRLSVTLPGGYGHAAKKSRLLLEQRNQMADAPSRPSAAQPASDAGYGRFEQPPRGPWQGDKGMLFTLDELDRNAPGMAPTPTLAAMGIASKQVKAWQ